MNRVPPEEPDHLDPLDRQVFKVPLDLPESKDLRANKDPPEKPEIQVLKVPKVLPVSKVLPDLKVSKVLQVQQVLQVAQVPPEVLDPQEVLVLREVSEQPVQ